MKDLHYYDPQNPRGHLWLPLISPPIQIIKFLSEDSDCVKNTGKSQNPSYFKQHCCIVVLTPEPDLHRAHKKCVAVKISRLASRFLQAKCSRTCVDEGDKLQSCKLTTYTLDFYATSMKAFKQASDAFLRINSC